MTNLRNWCIVEGHDPYTAPECQPKKLAGNVYNHSEFLDGTWIVTSRVVNVEARTITTRSGSVYLLEGDPNPDYVKWCQENKLSYKKLYSNNPI